MNASELIAVVIASYLIGSIPVGYLVGRALRGIDIREQGSGSSGATNALRLLGKGPFFAIMALDALMKRKPPKRRRYPGNGHHLQLRKREREIAPDPAQEGDTSEFSTIQMDDLRRLQDDHDSGVTSE